MKKKYNVRSQATPKIGKTILKLSTLSLSMMCLTMAQAAETEQSSTDEKPTKVVKVAVTGSSIKGVAAQSASPITVVKVDEILKQGVTTTEEALSKITANQAGFVTAQNVGASGTAGSTANLRGIGANKTLILLNGRRLAANAYDSGVTNLNIIPLAMLDRIEVLRDGASAIYGTDAIGGVINFITKKQFTGLNISAGLTQPEQTGGDTQDISVFGGFGDLDENGFNVFGVVDYRHGNDIMAKDRKVSERGGLLPELGVKRSSSGAFPANISKNLGNPYAATGCGDNPLVYVDENTCRFNSQAVIGIVPKTEDISAMGRATFKLNDNFNAIAEYVYARNEVTTSVAPDVFFDLPLEGNSKYYPGNGITPALAGVNGQDITLSLRSQAGNRVSTSVNESHRIFGGLEGEAYGWDINTGITYAKSKASDALDSGYLNYGKTSEALLAGKLNPFGAQQPEDAGLWGTLGVTGKYMDADVDSTTVDFTASRPIYTLPAGDVGFAVGASYRRDDWTSKVNSEIASLAPSTGVDPDEPVNKGKREIKAAFTELHIPLHRTLEAQLAARYDDYSDFGDTFNPKFALRWEPIKQLMFRTSYSTGFRAPTLWEMNAPNSVTNTSASYDDPILCPGGKVNEAAGGDKSRDCNMQFDRKNGGNKDLDAEESKSFTAGFVLEPIKNLVLTLDYYNIEVEKQISALPESDIFNNPTKYADKFVRNSDGSLAYIITTQQNMGDLKTSGIDVSLNYATPMTATGRYSFGIDGTYVIKYDYQNEKDGEWIHNVGSYEGTGSIIRWKHVANLNWNYQDWALNFQQQFTRGYDDQNANDQNHKVSDYTLYNVSGTYKGFKNLELTAGIKNIFDEEPAATNVEDNFQMGYDPRYSDPTGRTYFLRGTYKF
ncbi:TPA: TonB-dependent receptor [Acinetobacter baumannii]|nr:TonB-dependent receptor [Acinetobacter baumannii]MDC4981843.1 TonB-dependent receptor [Acinetobacter baumannii]